MLHIWRRLSQTPAMPASCRLLPPRSRLLGVSTPWRCCVRRKAGQHRRWMFGSGWRPGYFRSVAESHKATVVFAFLPVLEAELFVPPAHTALHASACPESDVSRPSLLKPKCILHSHALLQEGCFFSIPWRSSEAWGLLFAAGLRQDPNPQPTLCTLTIEPCQADPGPGPYV